MVQIKVSGGTSLVKLCGELVKMKVRTSEGSCCGTLGLENKLSSQIQSITQVDGFTNEQSQLYLTKIYFPNCTF